MARTKRKVNPLHHPDAGQETARTEQRIYHAAGYVRLSLEDSGRPGADTIDSQTELVRGYIEASRIWNWQPCTAITDIRAPAFHALALMR